MKKCEGILTVNYFARIVSLLLHPLLIPVYLLLFIFNGDTMFVYTPWTVKMYCYLITVFALLVMPMASLPLFRHLHLIQDYKLSDHQDRVYPILVAVGFAFLGFWLLGRVAYTNIVQQLYLVLIILLSAFSVVTLRWKISMHMTAVGGFCGFLLVLALKYPGDVRSFFIFMLMMSGLLASCRLYLEKHTPLQVYLGFLFGLCFVLGILF